MNEPGLVMEMPGSIRTWRVGNVIVGVTAAVLGAVLLWQVPVPPPLRVGLALITTLLVVRHMSRRIIRLSFMDDEIEFLLPLGRRRYRYEELTLFDVFPVYANSAARVKLQRKSRRWPEYFWFQWFYTSLGWPRQTVDALRGAGVLRGLTPVSPQYGVLDLLYRPVGRAGSSAGRGASGGAA